MRLVGVRGPGREEPDPAGPRQQHGRLCAMLVRMEHAAGLKSLFGVVDSGAASSARSLS